MTPTEELIHLIGACLLCNSIENSRSLQKDFNKHLNYEQRRLKNEDSINYQI